MHFLMSCGTIDIDGIKLYFVQSCEKGVSHIVHIILSVCFHCFEKQCHAAILTNTLASLLSVVTIRGLPKNAHVLVLNTRSECYN